MLISQSTPPCTPKKEWNTMTSEKPDSAKVYGPQQGVFILMFWKDVKELIKEPVILQHSLLVS